MFEKLLKEVGGEFMVWIKMWRRCGYHASQNQGDSEGTYYIDKPSLRVLSCIESRPSQLRVLCLLDLYIFSSDMLLASRKE